MTTTTDEDPFGHAPVLDRAPAQRKARTKVQEPPPATYTGPIELVIYGEPASKANSRKLATVGPADNRRMLFIKSEKARNYERDALKQIPPAVRLQLTVPVSVTLRLFYANERPDLDEAVVLDVLQNRYRTVEVPGRGKERVLVQAGVYVNDRQVREKHVYHGIDKANPRAEVRIVSISPQEVLL